MTQTQTVTPNSAKSIVGMLLSDRPAPDRAAKMGLYAFLVGRWETEATIHLENGTKLDKRGEIHASWALEGRALQDVWTLPGVFYGTTLRVYDPSSGNWHILWIDPVRQAYPRMIGRARGSDIVQEGTGDNGATLRWSFSELTPESFLWRGEISPDGGATWRLQVEIRARRMAP